MNNKFFHFLLAALLLAAVHLTQAQPHQNIARLGYLRNNPISLRTEWNDFIEELRKRGWIEGHNVIPEQRFWENKVDRLRAHATELVGLNVNIIVTTSGAATREVKKATPTIPIVMIGSADAVTQGLVESLARPGGNVTGVTHLSPWLTAKQLQLLKEAFPRISRVAIVNCGPTRIESSSFTDDRELWDEAQKAARVQKTTLLSVPLRGPGGSESALKEIIRERTDALLVTNCVTVPSREFIEFAAKSRLPAIYPFNSYVKLGGLMSYGADRRETYRRGAHFVDKILKGATPADLPVEQPTKFELAINLKTAKDLGVTIPPQVIMWADEVIQ